MYLLIIISLVFYIQMVGPKWVITPLEKMQFDELFFKADTDMDGYVNGNEIKDIFLQSGLQQIVLAHIWFVLFNSIQYRHFVHAV